MSPVVLGICLVMLAVAAAGVLYRLVKGPALLDRVLASDVLLAVVAAAIAVEMVWKSHTDYMIVIVTLSLLGFIGSVSVARFVQPTRPRKTGETDGAATKEPAATKPEEQEQPATGADSDRRPTEEGPP